MKLFICAQVFVYYLLWTMAIHIPFSISFIANCYHVVVNFDLSQEYVHKFSIDIFGVAPSLSVSPDKLVFTKYNTHTYSERYMNVARVFCIYIHSDYHSQHVQCCVRIPTTCLISMEQLGYEQHFNLGLLHRNCFYVEFLLENFPIFFSLFCRLVKKN